MNILNVVLFIVAMAAITFYFVMKLGLKNLEGKDFMSKKNATNILIAGIIVLLLSMSIKTINSDVRGLRFTFGAISPKALDPGLHFKAPFIQSIENVSIQPIEIKAEIEVDGNGAITKDNQTIGANLTLFFVYDKDRLPIMWKDFGEEKIMTILTKSMIEAFKAQVGRYDIFVLPLTQDTIRMKTLKQIRSMVNSYPLTVTELKITNYDWSEDFDKQIKETMNRSQQVKQKEQELLITEQEAQKKVKNAEAEKTATITQAEGKKIAAGLEAEAKALEGEGIKKYNDAVAKNMTLEIELRKLRIEEIKAQRWNGQYVPTNNYGPIPIETGAIMPAKK